MTAPWRQPALPAPADPVVDPATVTEQRRELIPRFGDPVWSLTFISDNPSTTSDRIQWQTFPAELREQFRHAVWALLNFPVPDTVLTRGGSTMRARLSPQRMFGTAMTWRVFATWLSERGITELAQATTDVLADYGNYVVKTRKVARNTATSHLIALTRLRAFAPYLPTRSRIGVPPWETEGFDDYLPAATAAGENSTEPISPATMGPLLIWALKFTEEFADDILAARAEEQRLRRVVAQTPDTDLPRGTPPALIAYLADLEATGKPLPTHTTLRSGAAATYVAAITGTPHKKVHRVLKTPRWQRYRKTNPGRCPLDIPITGLIEGDPWVSAIDFDQVEPFVRLLTTACFVVIAYLTGMRPSEVLALEVGCCPEPRPGRDDSSGGRRHLIHARHFKTARDADGNHRSAGELREVPWVAVPPVVTAIRVLERLNGPAGLLFPAQRGERQGRSPVRGTVVQWVEGFVDWVNEHTAKHGRGVAIPADPHGNIGTARFRRSLAWHIARRPGGLVALAVQYGHMRTVISEGYATRQRDGIHELLDLETARAVAEQLSEVHDALDHGEGVSGPAARRLIRAAHEQHDRFGGLVTTPRQAKALLADPALTVFDNADAYLACNYDPGKALCNPANASGPTPTPSLDRCHTNCSNIARTDTHARQLRTAANQIRAQADSPLVPQPVAERLKHRAASLIELADTHDRTRITTTDPEPR
ncbi:integrase [Nocardia cyriacigeorgica]|uniref:Uncharacterized protein n=6 Tax=Nocardia cyriacigeorgica TaxID=135487 RepID=A0A4U8VVN6_9NOCA|nr:integrase [Nocardia cyriacigeorgica]MBF6083168.1 integrase [Nocardia cyriacigeorgica]MBF6090484.1 integrase [Nocardia cyriacigeorgica]MBF6098110.1 integrase [Nocardia cyriacigeorgica]MBF6157835.1 integrase [Nocardia cyriacigeorgica]MBF6196807.1 integrase [Nocardia cyriacigeorgica]